MDEIDNKTRALRHALDILARTGHEADLKQLSQESRFARSSIYRWFKNNAYLQVQMADLWSKETDRVIRVAQNGQTGLESLRLILQEVAKMNGTRLEAPMESLAKRNPQVAEIVRKTHGRRFAFVVLCFERLGYVEDELMLKTRMFIAAVNDPSHGPALLADPDGFLNTLVTPIHGSQE